LTGAKRIADLRGRRESQVVGDHGCQEGEIRAWEVARSPDREAPCWEDALCLQMVAGNGGLGEAAAELALVVIPVLGVPRDD